MSYAATSDAAIRKAVKYLEESIDWSGGSGESIMYDFYVHHPEYNPELYEDAPEPPKRLFAEWFKDYALGEIDRVDFEIQRHFNDSDEIPIWRVITAPADWTPDAREIGIFWSWDKNHAEAHWGQHGKGHHKWRIGSVAKRKQIDWPITLALNAEPGIGDDEREIRLKEGQKVPILSLEVNEDRYGRSFRPVPTATWSGKLFRANP